MFEMLPQPVIPHPPAPPKLGYKTSPPFEDIVRMVQDGKIKIPRFTISNEHGSVQFEGETDVSDVDLADVVTIAPLEIEVYNQETNPSAYPRVGEKLNRPAILTYNNAWKNVVGTSKAKVDKYKSFSVE